MNYQQKAADLFKQGYNCSQAVLGAFCETCHLDFDEAMKLSSSFGGGMGRLREVCGAVSAMFMVAGLKYGSSDPQDKAAKARHYQLIQQLAEAFEKDNHSIICRELLGLQPGKDSPIPEERTEGYYKKRPCVELVECAAQILDELLHQNQLNLK